MDTLFYERSDPRYKSNLVIYVRMKSWNPFSYKQAKLIDFSLGGFKIEFLENIHLKNMEKILLIIPLQDFYIGKLKVLKLKAEIKWYDPLYKQVGGTYHIQMKQGNGILEKIISALAQKIETEQK